ncbi:DNA topoisomerase III [Turicibacter sp. H121]|uniref:DNA topoisomerase III n=1 Tax=Turicibacter sp. H121 TaxID=1712675 RepID=UPI000762E781|nr:DNA topoisomerase III [Turicibacter sp. H121]AMC09252.1 DNA topoisomerase III [Turicibacter sp. H121]MCU7199508.1 DNA topoisomerase III [Turicibacter sp. H121]
MSKRLVLAEKPSVGRDIARVLNCTKQGNGYLEGKDYIVTWALGHLVTLADPEAYDVKYKSWNLEDLPMLPKQFKLVVIPKTSKQFKAVKEQMLRKDVSEIIIATDAGREGELVARWIIEKVGVKKPIKRLWISSVTDKAIQQGFKTLKDGRNYDNLYSSAIARSEADWIVGMNATRALTTKHNAQLSCGRVQTPTLAMIAKREEEIKQFKPKTYYGLTAISQGIKWTWQDGKSKDIKTFNEERIGQLFKSLQGQSAQIEKVAKTEKKVYAPGLYDLTELQRDANRMFGFSAKETLSIMQKLYEHHKVLTYPRTDSRYISTDIVETLPERLKAVAIGPYRAVANQLLKGKLVTNKSFVDDKKVSDHHAIIPTEQTALLTDLSDKERKIFDLVVKRFLAVLSKPFVYEQTTLTAKIGSETFVAKGKRVLSLGFKEIYSHQDEEADDHQNLPLVEAGTILPILKIIQTSGRTQPPAYFNEATLLSAMENPARFMNGVSSDVVKTLNETGGLGTVATRADIIEKLFNSFMIEKKGQEIHLTSKGRQLLDLAPTDLKSPELTGEWEQKLSDIASGKLKRQSFVNQMREYATTVVQEIKGSDAKYKHDNLTTTKCPECGKPMLAVNGKRGKMLVCQDRECGTRKTISQITNSRCPNCHKKLELRGEGENRMFACVCGHREKLSTYNKRKQEQKKQGSKRDVQKYLREQEKNSEPMNSALADALANLKL